jgi:two-component system phosphate regulon response regulator PhoB
MKKANSKGNVSNLRAYERKAAGLQEESNVLQEASGDDAIALLDVQNPDIISTHFVVRRSNFKETMARIEQIFDIETIDARAVKVGPGDTGFKKQPENDRLSNLFELDLSPRVFVANINATLKSERYATPSKESVIRIENLLINTTRHQVFLSGKQINMTKTEFKTLHFLAQRPGWAFTRAEILHGIHGVEYYVGTRTVNVCIRQLRKKLGDAGHYIETVRDVGYRMKDFEG